MNETKPRTGQHDDDVRDEQLEASLRGAYDMMDPTPEQEKRMLSALLAAQEAQTAEAENAVTQAGQDEIEQIGKDAAAQEGQDGAAHRSQIDQAQAAQEDEKPSVQVESASGTTSQSQTQSQATPSANRSRGFKVWKVAVPLAACLALIAVVFGISGTPNGNSAPNASISGPSPTVELSTSSADTSKKVSSSETSATSAESTTGAESAKSAPNEIGDVVEIEEDTLAYEPKMANDNAYGALGATSGIALEAATDESMPYPGTFVDPDFNTEEYDALKETGFVSTKANPLSTVSADVDTASYCNLRRMINDGYTAGEVPAGSVRIEEMLNYFDYDYAQPTGDDLFSMRAQSAPCPWNENTQLLVMGFSTAEESKAASKGSNLVFLVDVSGSMNSPDKLDLLQDSFATLLESLDGHDRVSIVTYANGEEIVLEGATGDDKTAILKAIYKLRADGATNGEAGLKQAYEVAERNFIEGGVNRIIMASDGDLNVGMSSESDLYDFVDKKRESGIYLSVLGFGSGNYKDNKMETVADHGNGSYHYIDCIEEAERVLKDKLTANLVPFADNVKVQVEFNPAQVKGYRLIGYENRALADEDFRNDAVDAGDVGPNSQFTVVYEVALADSKQEINEPELKYGADAAAGDASGDWLTCSLRYHAFDGDEMREQQLDVGPSSVMGTPSADWSLAAAVCEFGMLLRDSTYAGTSSEDSILELLANAANDEQVSSLRRLVTDARLG